MLFNSIEFLVFLPTVFILYWFVFKNQLKAQNLLLLVASYVFYGWWDWRFLSLIAFSTMIDFVIAKQLGEVNEKRKRQLLLWLSIIANLGLLGFFKYFNFFIDSWVEAWQQVGVNMHVSTLKIILPVGISFYTFQTLSYTIDVYRKHMKPTKSIIDFAVFVSFFPQLVAGPIERAKHLLPQFYVLRQFSFEMAKSGIYLILWGLFKKVVIADSCAIYVNDIFDNYQDRNTLSLIMGSIYFAFQIYGDFSGYSDMAIGTSRLFGFDLMCNFKYPYFSRNSAEFWRRWHISLSTWFRDYLYIPLGGSQGNKIKQIRNVFIVFIVSGFWHGANWTFIAWGFINAIYFLPLLLKNKNKNNMEDLTIKFNLSGLKSIISILFTFSITCLAWVFFRSETIAQAIGYLKQIFLNKFFKIEFLAIDRYSVELLLLLGIFILVEWFSKEKEEPISGRYSFLKLTLVILGLLVLGVYSAPQDFMYFQF